MVYKLQEARIGSGKRDSIIDWYYSNPAEETFENYKNSPFYVEQPKASWYATVSLLRRGQLKPKNAKPEKETKEEKVQKVRKASVVSKPTETSDSERVLHGDLVHTFGASSRFRIEDWTVEYFRLEDKTGASFESEFNFVDLDELNDLLNKGSATRVAAYLEKKSNMGMDVEVDMARENFYQFKVTAVNSADKLLVFRRA